MHAVPEANGGSVLSMNQVVAYNLRRARVARGWSQARLGRELRNHLGRAWSVATVSAAERSVDGARPRRFDADEITALAVLFGFPIAFFFLPPEKDESPPCASFATADAAEDGDRPTINREQLAQAIDPFVPPAQFVDRLRQLLDEFHISVNPGARVHRDWMSAEQANDRNEVLRRFGVEPKFREGPTGATTAVQLGLTPTTYDESDDDPDRDET